VTQLEPAFNQVIKMKFQCQVLGTQ